MAISGRNNCIRGAQSAGASYRRLHPVRCQEILIRRPMEIEQSPQQVVVIGGGGHARVVISILRKLNAFSIAGYIDRTDRGDVLGASFLGTDEIFLAGNAAKKMNAVLAV